jgi:hypothetical protein
LEMGSWTYLLNLLGTAKSINSEDTCFFFLQRIFGTVAQFSAPPTRTVLVWNLTAPCRCSTSAHSVCSA